jgi:DNA modification methylase
MLESVWEELGAFVHQQIVWSKSRPVLTYSVYMWAHEPCFFGWLRGNKPPVTKREHYPSTVWDIPSSEVESKDHPTSKPPRVFRTPLELHTNIGDVCYEPFSGSGSQLIAAQTCGRLCYGLEISPQYVDVAVTRWQAFTGLTATLDGDGRSFGQLAAERRLVSAS